MFNKINIMFDLTEAQNNARNEVEKIIAVDPELCSSEVEEVRLERETELAWTFTADIPKLINEGWLPGAITVLIDKKDGHVLTEEEQAAFHKNWSNTRRRAGFIRQK
jgi:ribonucleotide reductase beta subunit family protein with ferritin-like domain